MDRKEDWVLKNRCFQTVVLEKTLESPLDYKKIQPVHPKRNQAWIFTGRTDPDAEAPIFLPPNAMNWLTGKDPDAGKDWRWEEKGTTEDEMVEWHHQLNGHEFEQTLGNSKDQGGMVRCGPGVAKNQTWLSNWTTINILTWITSFNGKKSIYQ